MIEGNISKMTIEPGAQAHYYLRLSDQRLPLNDCLGKTITFRFSGVINCVNCGRQTKKSYSQGHCYPCSKKLASCDLCIMKPETCHYEQGTCREPDWGLQHCFQPHFVYLANSSGIKVGITRHSQVPTRWLDQGAGQALPIYRVASRYISGLVEEALKAYVNDKTDWRKMLKFEAEAQDLLAVRDELLAKSETLELQMKQRFGDDAITRLPEQAVVEFHYPVTQYPSKVSSIGFDKTPEISGVLTGIKGQYLMLDNQVLNMRKHSGYYVQFEVID